MPGELGSLLTFVLDLLARLRPGRLLPRALDQARGQGGRAPTRSGTARPRRCERSAPSADLELVIDEGGGAFYGPKISVQARDAIGRTHQISTIQLDFQEPQRFGLEYVGADNARHRPVMIHRALFGSVERFLAILLEHYAGTLPTWLMPEQVRVLPVKEDVAALRRGGGGPAGRGRPAGRASTRPTPGSGPRVGKAKVQKIPYVLVVGDSDVAAGTVGVNRRGAKDPERAVPLDRFVAEVTHEVAARAAGPSREAADPGRERARAAVGGVAPRVRGVGDRGRAARSDDGCVFCRHRR